MKPVSGEMPDRQNLLAFLSGPQGPPGSSGLQVLKIEIFTTPPRCSIVKHELQKISYARLVYVKMCQQVSPLNHWQVRKWNHVCQNVPVDTATYWATLVLDFCNGSLKDSGAIFVK